MKRIMIWGAGGHAKVVADVARACGYQVLGFVDRDRARIGDVVDANGTTILYDDATFREVVKRGDTGCDALAIGIGANAMRLTILRMFENTLAFPTIVHPTAVLSPSCTFGHGTVVMAHV